ncbi:unnamed protein product [Linum trigynum]|uniref:DUF7026 domain-containing protein n=1 Tax=Linum trigynum TaxID=586398 RepID=A0AAV2EV66_9ROSI
MALRIHQCRPNPLLQQAKLQAWPLPSGNHLPYNSRPRTQILCTRNKSSSGDSNLASDFAMQVSRINTNLAQKEEAMKKSRELLFCELCKFLDLEEDKVKKTWSEMELEDKMVLVKGFVDVWGANFHPLSARCVKELIEEHIQEQKDSSSELSSAFFPGLRRLMGFATE